MQFLMTIVLFFSFLNTTAAEAQRAQQPAIRGVQKVQTGNRVMQNGIHRHHNGARRWLYPRGVITTVTPGGVFFGAGWFPYWGVRYNYPFYSVPFYGQSYYRYWNFGPRYASFGAISYSPATDRAGLSWSQGNRDRAVAVAQRQCGEKDCQPMVWAQGGCAAIARSEETKRVAYGYHAQRYRARQLAEKSCAQSGAKDCKLRAWICTY